jgi:cell division protease FtsH
MKLGFLILSLVPLLSFSFSFSYLDTLNGKVSSFPPLSSRPGGVRHKRQGRPIPQNRYNPRYDDVYNTHHNGRLEKGVFSRHKKTVTTTEIVVPREIFQPHTKNERNGRYDDFRKDRLRRGNSRTSSSSSSSIDASEIDGMDDDAIGVFELPDEEEQPEEEDPMEKMDDDDKIRYRRRIHERGGGSTPKDGSFWYRQTQKERKKKSSADTFELVHLNSSQFSFATIGGCDEIKQELLQINDMVGNKVEEYKKWNVRLPRGILLYGEPGNGKTLLAKCFTGETGLPIISTSGAHFQEKYVGTGAARIRELFDFARQEAPCIVYIDEIDAVARKRGSDGEAAQAERDSTLNQLLVEMDGFGSITEDRILVIGSTNRLDILDAAILRPGRFDKKIHIPRPDASARSKILDIHMTQKPLDVPKEWLVNELTVGMSGAEIEHLLNEASLFGIRHSFLPINSTMMEAIREVLILGLTAEHVLSPKPRLPKELEQRIAIHEMGHVLVSLFSPTHPNPQKVTIYSPSSQMLGYTIFGSSSWEEKLNVSFSIPLLSHFLSSSDIMGIMSTKNSLYEKIQVLLGGRMAEELLLGPLTISSGASDDFKKAQEIAYEMILHYGMGTDLFYPTLSDQSKRNIDKAAMEIIHQCTENVRILLHTHRSLLEFMSKKLLQHGSLKYVDIIALAKEFSSLTK